MTDAAKSSARRLERSPLMRGLARGGYVASGVVHLLIGVLVLVIASGGRDDADQAGALRAIAEAPLGPVALWVIAALLAALALYHVLEGLVLRESSAAKRWGRRLSEWGQAIVFGALGGVAASIALGARPRGDESAEGASRGVLHLPGGAIMLGAVGLAIAGGGVAFAVMGLMRSFEKKISLPSGARGTGVKGLGVAGYLAKGVALAIVGALLVVAAVTTDADKAGGLDAAFTALRDVFLGPVLLAIVGVGFLAYGLFLFARARYARL